MKKRIITISITATLLLAIPVTLVSLGFALPSQFSSSFYGEIAVMYKKLKTAENKKIVFIGNSCVAFGVRTDLVASEMSNYDAVNFGCYGAVGTKAMLDWSKDHIKKDDIVVLMPEPYAQTSSLYFSGRDVWRAADSDFSLVTSLPRDHLGTLVGSFTGYVQEKFSYATGRSTLNPELPYSRDAFVDSEGTSLDYMVYDRPYNVMSGGYDKANLPVIGPEVFGVGFIKYLNEYAQTIKERGASIYFGFAPVNSLSLDDKKNEKADLLYDYLHDNLKFPVLGTPEKYFLDYRYFYDNNVHMNSAGAVIYTNLLCEDLKMAQGIWKPNSIELPEAPEVPQDEPEKGDDSFAPYFDYSVIEGPTEKYVRLTALKEEGQELSAITLPSSIEGLPVREFAQSVFAYNKTISRLVLPKTITAIYDGSFLGCDRLVELRFLHDSILGISAGSNYLDGAPNCYIYIKKGVSVADCAGGWERYMSRIRYY